MAKITVTVCDECGAQEGVKHFDIREGTRKATVDLCGAHSIALDHLLGGEPPVAQRPTRTRSRAAKRVTTMEEIEALKKK
jgi:hypothetical protein